MKRTVLLTGAAGFIGSHMIEHILKTTDWNIVAMVRMTQVGNLNRLSSIETDDPTEFGKRVKIVHHDFIDAVNPSVSRFLEDVDTIIHMGAESHVERTLNDPVPCAYSNVIGTCNMLEYYRQNKDRIKDFVFISTDEVFGSAPDGVFYKEQDHKRPGNPYSASKSSAEEFVYAFSNSFGLKCYVTRAMNCFGEKQEPEKLIPMVMKRVHNEETVTIHGNEEIIGSRTWLHARNYCDGVTYLLQNNAPANDVYNTGIYNISGNIELDNLEIAKRIAELIGKELKYELVDFHKTRPGHDRRYALDGSKILGLGWVPPFDFDNSMKKVVDWTLSHEEWLR